MDTTLTNTITKEDVRQAFSQRRRGKFNLLYLHYRQQYFHKGLPAQLIAHKISTDLGLTITATNIYEIHRRHAQVDLELKELKAQIKHEIIESLRQDPKAILPPAGPSEAAWQQGDQKQDNQKQGSQSVSADGPVINPALGIDEFELFLQNSALSLDKLHIALDQQTDVVKRIILSEKIKQVRFVETYNNASAKKSIFD